MAQVERSTTIPTAVDEVWSVLSELGRIAEWAPNVDHSTMLSHATDGVGAARRVQTGRMTLVETVVDWNPPDRFAYSITGLPARLGAVSNEWRLAARDGSTEVTLTTTVDPGPRPPQQLIGRIVAARLAKASDAMLAGLTDHLTTGAVP
jgi:hypothetical protein